MSFVNQSSCRKFTAVRLQYQMLVSLTVQRKELQVKSLDKSNRFYHTIWTVVEKFDSFLGSIKCDVYCSFSPSVFEYIVKPRRGDALLFFSLHPNAIPDENSLHAGCPVIEGEKWSATKWIHVDSFDKILDTGGNCTDLNESCERWAALGECTKNREYMVGSADLPGYCRRSCKVC